MTSAATTPAWESTELMTWPITVKAVSEMVGVSIRTLHDYDEIGLLKPAQVTASGYRLYTDQDLERLQRLIRTVDRTLEAMERGIRMLHRGLPGAGQDIRDRCPVHGVLLRRSVREWPRS